jgi:hypothetical protein
MPVGGASSATSCVMWQRPTPRATVTTAASERHRLRFLGLNTPSHPKNQERCGLVASELQIGTLVRPWGPIQNVRYESKAWRKRCIDALS